MLKAALQRRAVFCRILLSSWQPIKLRLAACFRREASPLGLGQPRVGAISQSAFASRLGFRRAASPLGLEGLTRRIDSSLFILSVAVRKAGQFSLPLPKGHTGAIAKGYIH